MLHFRITIGGEHEEFEHRSGPIELGRGPQRGDVPRHVIADKSVSRDQLRVEELAAGGIRLVNLSQRQTIRLGDNRLVGPGDQCELKLPAWLATGDSAIEIEWRPDEDSIGAEVLATIAAPLRRPDPGSRAAAPGVPALGEKAPTPETLARWFETVIAVQRAAAGSAEFYEQTAGALVDLVGLDRGLVLLRRGDSWEPVARKVTREGERGREFSTSILRHVVEEGRTFYQAAADAPLSESLQGVEAVVASPIFGANDQVVGALYGSRARYAQGRVVGIGPLEAHLVQMLASAVGAGLARLEQEAEVTRSRVQFEQFFSGDLARELQRNPRLLDGQERTVTAMFCDIRGFSRLSEGLSPSDVCRILADVMERVTARITAHEGVVVDYMGDGLLAMWNAPSDQPDHAVLACRAALGIVEEVPHICADWQERVGRPIALGVGLNTGPALVGNIGTRQKFKYGPLGHTLNLASRVEGATKQFGIPILITRSTRELLGDAFATRRICKVRVVGMQHAVDLYELHAETAPPEWLRRRDAYEAALALFEDQKLSAACREIYSLLASQGEQLDIPSLNIASRAVEYQKSPPESFDSTWMLTSK
jgi:adenylate cyclase